MGQVKIGSDRGLNYTAHLSIDEAKRNAQELKKILAEIGINSMSQAQKQFNGMQVEFQNELKKSRVELAKLKKEEQELKNTRLQTAAEIAEVNKQLAKNRLEQQELRKAAKKAREENKATVGSYKEAQERLKLLGNEIRNTTGGFQKMTPALKEKIKEYRELNDRLKEFDATMGNHQRNVGNYKAALDGLKSYIAAFFTLQTALQGLRFVVSTNAEISDSLADVRRTAGLTAEEAENLSEQLKKIDTRTSLKGLLEIATIGGQLGIAKDQLGGFTKAVDQLAVSLSGELQGGAEGIAKSLGVLDNVFGITKQNAGDVEKSYNQIGSAILGLGQSGLATGDYLTDFANRVGGLAKQFGISLPVVLAYGAVLQESGVNAEVAGTSFNRLISNLATNRVSFFNVAKIADANLTLKEFTNIINTDTNKAMSLFFAGLQKGGTSTTSFNDILKKLKLTGAGVSQAVAALAGHQEDLNGHIQQANKDFQDATLSVEQFALKNDNLAAVFEKIRNKISNIFTDSGFSQQLANLLNGFISNKTEAEKLADQYKDNKRRADDLESSLNPLVTRYDQLRGKVNLNTAEQEELKKVTAQIGNLLPGVTTKFDDYGNSIDISRTKISELTKAQKTLLELQNREAINANNAAFDKAMKQLPQAKKNAEEMQKTTKTLGDRISNFFYGDDQTQKRRQGAKDIVTRLSGRTYEAAKAVRDLGGTLTKAQKDVIAYYETINNTSTGQTPKPGETNDPPIIGDTKKVFDTHFDEQRKMQARIDELKRKGLAKEEDRNQQEIDDIKAKYATMLADAVAFNKKVDEFNSNPKNKVKRQKVNTSGLDVAMKTEIDSTVDGQLAKTLKEELDLKQKYYEEFENLKTSIGVAEAKKRYEKLINVDQTYLQFLASKEESIRNPQKSKGDDGTYDGKSAEKQLKVIRERLDQEKIAEQKKNDELLAQFIGFTKKKKLLEEAYQYDIERLGDDHEAKLNRKARYDKEYKDLVDANSKNLAEYEKLFDGIENMSSKSAKKLLNKTRKEFEEGVRNGLIKGANGNLISPEEIKKILALFDQMEAKIREGNGQALIEMANQIDAVASSVEGLNENFGNVLRTISNVIGQVGNIRKNLESFNKAKGAGDVMGQLGAGLGIFGAGLSIFQGIFSMFDKSAQRQAQAAYSMEIQAKQSEALNRALERQIQLLDKVYGTDRIKGYSEAITKARDNETKYMQQLSGKLQLTGNKSIDELITRINNGETKFGPGLNEQVAQMRKTLALQLPKEIDKLRELLGTGKLDANTETIVQNLIKANETAIELANNLNAEKVGTTLEQIADDFISTLTDGTKDFGKTFEDTIQKSILNGFKGELIRKQLQAFYDQFAELSTDGLTSDEIAKLRKTYMDAMDKAKKDLSDLSAATGIDLKNGSSNDKSLSKSITGITEQTANRLEAEFGGMRIAQLQTNAILTPIGKSLGDLYLIARDNFAVQQQIEKNTFRTANNTTNIPQIVEELRTLNKKIADVSALKRGAGL